MKQILLVEDDESLGSTLTERLLQEGYKIIWAQTLLDARKQFTEMRFDLAILDVGLPDGSGLTLGREIKETSVTPLIFLTAMNSAEYRLEGFELGADDYIPKPFHLKELLLRIQKLLDSRSNKTLKKAGELTLNFEMHQIVFPDGHKESLAVREFELLKFLLDESPRIVSRSDILSKVFRAESDSNSRSVDNSILKIRNILGTFAEGHLRSVRGVGYQWVR